MAEARAGGLTIYYETEGDASGAPLLLVMGLGSQMTSWHPAFRAALVERGFFVVRFDNRDVGLSSWLDDAGTPDVMAALGGKAKAPYLLRDMAGDAVAVLDAVGIGAAHVVGVSMGGMIAQTLAIEYPERVRTLTSIMSTTGDPSVGAPHAEAISALLAPPATDRSGAIEQSVRTSRVISSPGYPFDEPAVRTRAEANYDRAFHPVGTARQFVAILSSGDRTEGLRSLPHPTLVIHGDGDPLVDVSGGRATAAAVPGAVLQIVPGMGHDLPVALHRQVADAIADLAGV